MLNLAHDPTKIIAVGKSGMGKTVFTNDWLLRSNYRYYFVFDHDGQFAQRHRLKPAFTLEEASMQLARSRFVIFDPSEKFADPERAVDFFACWTYKICERLRGPKLFYCDEIQDVCGTNKAPFWLRKVLVSGRTKSLDFIGASLQYNMIHNAIRGQATTTIAFNTDEGEALKKLIGRGFRADEIVSLRPGEFILRNHRTGISERGKIILKRR